MKSLVALFGLSLLLLACGATKASSPSASCSVPPTPPVEHEDVSPILSDEGMLCLVWYPWEDDGHTVHQVFVRDGTLMNVRKRLSSPEYAGMVSLVKKLIAAYPQFKDRKSWPLCTSVEAASDM